MLTRVDISNYRGFKSYRMEGLSQVNLIVGKNNSGKTALLEALNFATTGGDPLVLADAASRRGELIAADEGPRLYPDLTHFFHGHEITPGSVFTITPDNGYPRLVIRLIPLPPDSSLFDESDEEIETRPVFGVIIEGASGIGSSASDLGLSPRGGLIFNPKARIRAAAATSIGTARPSLFVPTDSVTQRRLAQLWRQAVLDANQQDALAAIQIIADSIKQIVVLPSEGSTRAVPSLRDWYVITSEARRPVPLGSFGDGVRRLMTLALSLSRVGGGTLFIDEIDTGLHYSVMADMWKLVVKKALESKVQVFATTHSWDCIEGLSTLCQREPGLMDKVAIHKIDRALQNSVAFSGESLVRMLRSDIDPR
jgi:hypothetical protein